jgi:hypothetical protein
MTQRSRCWRHAGPCQQGAGDLEISESATPDRCNRDGLTVPAFVGNQNFMLDGPRRPTSRRRGESRWWRSRHADRARPKTLPCRRRGTSAISHWSDEATAECCAPFRTSVSAPSTWGGCCCISAENEFGATDRTPGPAHPGVSPVETSALRPAFPNVVVIEDARPVLRWH